MNFIQKVNATNWWVILTLVGIIFFVSSFPVKYYGDDFHYVFTKPESKILYYFTHSNSETPFYRPLKSALMAGIQAAFGENTVPVHVMTLAIHLLLCWVVFRVLLALEFSTLQAVLASLFILISQATAQGVMRNNTVSQVGATCFSFISLWFAYKDRNYLLSIGAFVVALLFKETTVSYLVLIGGVLLLHHLNLSTVLLKILPYFFILVGYMLIRSWVGVEGQPQFGSEDYDFRVGLNIPMNILMFLYAASSPISSVTTFTAVEERAWGMMALMAVVSSLFGICVLVGLWRSPRRFFILLLGVSALIALFPMAMINHISELYLYNAMPFIAMIVGIGLGTLMETSSPGTQKLLWVGLLALVVSNFIAIQTKAALMRDNGERANDLVDQIKPYVNQIEPNGTLLLLETPEPDERVEYSIFVMHDFKVLIHGLNRIRQVTGRSDLEIAIVEPDELDNYEGSPMILILEGEQVVPYTSQ